MHADIPTFLIVTPSFNSAAWIDETISSVVSQSGGFRIRYHVQDGGSTDGTLVRLEQWNSLLASRGFPVLCAGVTFSFDSEKDNGMYDAINRAFDHIQSAGPGYMTYINADDRLLSGSLQFAATAFGSTEIAWVGGRPCEMNERGEMMRIHETQVYPGPSLRAGLHDGRVLPFVMQEGTFWRAEIWNKTGGFRTFLKQAGDWDLWRRFSVETPYITTDVVLAAHRRSQAQLTADMDVYHREVDYVVHREFSDLYRSERERFQIWASHSDDERDQKYYGGVLRFQSDESHGGTGQWKLEQRPCQAPLKTSIAVTNGFTNRMIPAVYESGFGGACGADLALNLLPGFRVSNAAICSIQFQATSDGLHRLFLRCRSFDPGVRLRLAHKDRTIFEAEIPPTGHDRDCVIIAEAVFRPGGNVIGMTLSGRDPLKTPVVLLVSCEAMSTI
jgi:glycosyltransferase involved in cell wall biosynthesis